MKTNLAYVLDQLRELLYGDVNDQIRIVFGIGPVREQDDISRIDNSNTIVSEVKGRVIAVLTLSSSQRSRVFATFFDRRDNPAPVQDVRWMTDNSDVVAIDPAADSTPTSPACFVRAIGPLGLANVTLRADGDPGDGIIPIIGTLQVQVTAGNATRVELNAGAPEEQPDDAAAADTGGTGTAP